VISDLGGLVNASFTATGWEGSFYPERDAIEPLAFYSERFHAVEVDATFYACPAACTVGNWASRTPGDFIFSVTITHERVLHACDVGLKQFLETMNILGKKLGPIVVQLPFFNRSVFRDRHGFLDRLFPFLKKLPRFTSSRLRFETEIGSARNSRICCAITGLRRAARPHTDGESIGVEF
jgi:uncharacterized protein YecE (DUF72 family)